MAGSVRRRIPGSQTGATNVTHVQNRRAALAFAASDTASMGNHAAWEAREVMDIRQAAEYLGISSDSLYKYASENVIPAFKLGNRWRFKRSLLDAWMEQQSSLSVVQDTPKSLKSKQKKPVSRVR